MVLESTQNAKLRRAGSQLLIQAKVSDLLFDGDAIVGKAAIAACGDITRLNLEQSTEIRRPQPCLLPPAPPERSLEIGPAFTRALSETLETEPVRTVPRPEAVDRELASVPGNELLPRVTRAEILARAGLIEDSAREYAAIRRDIPDARELATTRIFVLEQEAARKNLPKPDPTIGGQTYALLIGISEFQNAQIRPLKYAHEDAALFAAFLQSPRGGGIPAENIATLTNERATTAAIRTAFDTILSRATAKDTVLILIATHGTVVENPRSRSRGAYIVTYDSDPEDLATTGLPMSAVQKFIREDLGKTARVMAFIDACRSGTIGTIPDKSKIKIHAALDSLTQTDLQLFLFTASRPGEVSFEGRQYGGGHGAFSFFLLDALNGSADIDSDGKVTVSEMVGYVQQKVAEATVEKQHPREGGTLDSTIRIADLSKTGIEVGTYQPALKKEEITRGVPKAQQDNPVRVLNIRPTVDFDEAIAAGRLLPDETANAFTALRQLKLARRLNRNEIVAQENRLRIALEDQNQQALLQYLQGNQKPLTRADYLRASSMVSAAIQINGETPVLASRLLFCEGRVAMLDKQYAKALSSFESAVRFDPDAAYLYNALGTAYLEKGEFEMAETALQEAIQRAPQWAYPRHNLALVLYERGDTERAIAVYEDAIRLAPQHGYLAYNQGLMLQRLNRQEDAEIRYRKAAELNPEMPEPHNALGTLRFEQGRTADAETAFRRALERNTRYLEARQNLASLLWKNKSKQASAVALWRENLNFEASYLPSRLSLAAALAQLNHPAEAIHEYQRAISDAPDLVAAKVRVAELLSSAGRYQEARIQLEEARKRQPENPAVLEAMADLETAAGRTVEAATLYRAALAEHPALEQRSRLNSKLRGKAR